MSNNAPGRSLGGAPAGAAGGPADPSARLRALYADDCREHADVPAVGTPAYDALRARDRARRAEAGACVAALRAAGAAAADDLYHAAWLFNHGDDARDARRAHALARAAAAGGHRDARWLAAASYDRWRMYTGRPQRYGTQFVPDGVRYRLWDVDPRTADAERARWEVPARAEQERRAEQMTRDEPQPPMDQAPAWLRAALDRWRSA